MRQLLIALLTLCAGAQAGVALITYGQAENVNPTTATFAATTAGATLIVANIGNSAGHNSCSNTISDQVNGVATGNIWESIANRSTSTLTQCTWYTWHSGTGALVTGTPHTVTCNNGGSGACTVAISSWSGTLSSSEPLDVQTGTSVDPATSLGTGSITPHQNGSLILSASGERSSTTYTSTLTMVNTQNWVSGLYVGTGVSYVVQSTAAAISDTWTMSGSGQIAVTIAAFIPAAASGGSWRHLRWYGQ